MQHDPTYKAAFGHRRMVGDFLRLVIAHAPNLHGVLGALRLDTLERLPAEYVGPDLRRRFGDMVWRVQLRPGDGEWEAPVRYLDLRRPRAERSRPGTGAQAPLAGVLCPELSYMGEAFVVIDIRALDREALPEGNAATVLSLIEQVAVPVDVEEALHRLFETLPDAQDRSLGEVLLGWLRALAGRAGAMETEEFDEMVQRASAGRLRGRPEDRLRAWFAKARAEGEALGLERGEALALERERALMRRQATLRFDTGTGDRLAALLAKVTDPDRLAEVGEWIIECEDGAALLARTGASLSGP